MAPDTLIHKFLGIFSWIVVRFLSFINLEGVAKLDRAAKEQVVSEFKEIFNSSEIIIAVHYAGLDAVAINSLRKETYDNKVSFRVTKNRLIKLAIEKTPYDHIVELFKGPTAIAYSGDIVAASKIINKFSKNNDNLSIIGGALKDKVIDVEEIKE